MKKRILAALLALGCALLVFTGCGSKKDTAPKDYTQIIHDAREAEDNDYYMIFSPAEDGKFTAQYGYRTSSRRWSTTSRISIRSPPPPRWPLSPPAKWSWCAVRTAMP